MFRKKIKPEAKKKASYKSYYFSGPKSSQTFSDLSYNGMSRYGYIGNVVAHRCISLISRAVASLKLIPYLEGYEVRDTMANKIIDCPNGLVDGFEFVETIISHILISGNAYINLARDQNGDPFEFYILRPDRMTVVNDREGYPAQYIHGSGTNATLYDIDPISGYSDIIQFKSFNPIDDSYGLSTLSTAKYSIDQHNESISWNKSLLENGARPSGAIVVESEEGLSDDQFERLKNQIQSQFTGSEAAGKVMILEGGLRWQEMSISPKDMDFVEVKNSAARDIATALGVPSQLLGIQGDNTYSNYSEARMSFWEDTVIPLGQRYCKKISNWIKLMTGKSYKIEIDMDSSMIFNEKRNQIWNYVNNSTFLTDKEKREVLGFDKVHK